MEIYRVGDGDMQAIVYFIYRYHAEEFAASFPASVGMRVVEIELIENSIVTGPESVMRDYER